MPMLAKIANRFVAHVFPLDADLLRKWRDEPERYVSEDKQLRFDESIRPAAENLFTFLIQHFGSSVENTANTGNSGINYNNITNSGTSGGDSQGGLAGIVIQLLHSFLAQYPPSYSIAAIAHLSQLHLSSQSPSERDAIASKLWSEMLLKDSMFFMIGVSSAELKYKISVNSKFGSGGGWDNSNPNSPLSSPALSSMSSSSTSSLSFVKQPLFDFNTFYVQILSQELAAANSSTSTSSIALPSVCVIPIASVVKTRVASLIENFHSDIYVAPTGSDLIRKTIYNDLTRLLSDSDTVVRLTAMSALDSLVDDQERFQQFRHLVEPMIADILQRLIQLIQDTSEMETRKQILCTIRHLIAAMDHKIIPVVQTLTTFLPKLWSACSNASDKQLRSQIILTLNCLTQSLKAESYLLHKDILLPVLRHACNVSDIESGYLLEYGLELWHVVVQNAIQYTDELNELFKNWINLYQQVPASQSKSTSNTTPASPSSSSSLSVSTFSSGAISSYADQYNSNHIGVGMKLLESYVLLGREQFMQSYASSVSQIINALLDQASDKDSMTIVQVLERFAQLFPVQFLSVFAATSTTMLRDIQQCQVRAETDSRSVSSNSHINHNGILVQNDFVSSNNHCKGDRIISLYFQLLARLVFQNREGINDFIAKLDVTNNCTLAVIDTWLTKFDCISQPFQRKLSALALCQFLLTTNHTVLFRLPSIIIAVSGAIAEEQESDAFAFKEFDLSQHPLNKWTELHRMHHVVNTDPANKTKVKDVLMACLAQCAQANGTENIHNLLSQVDQRVIAQLGLNR
jgi:hypothetical protein